MGFITDSHSPSPTSPAPSTIKGQGQGQRSGDGYELSTLHIILISFGGVVFFIGIFVIIVLLKSRKKMCADSPSGAGSRSNVRRQSPIYVIGQTNRQGRGGDNPAFCRADEASGGGLPFPRNHVFTASQTRLPTYEEVMSGRVSTAPVSRPRSPQRSNSRDTSSQPHQHYHPHLHHQQQQQPQQHHRHQEGPPQLARGGQNNPEAVPPPSSSSGSAAVASRGRNSEIPLPANPPRYAYDYPSCYWEEVPPPPYTAVAGSASNNSGSNGRSITISGNCGVVRAMGGGAGPRQSLENATGGGGEEGSLSASGSGSFRGGNPCGRAPLAVPTPTVLSPVPSPALSVRDGGSRTSNSTSAPTIITAASSSTIASTTTPVVILSSSSTAIPTAPPRPLPSGAAALLSSEHHPAPLASSSPAVPRRHLTPAAAPALTHYLLHAAAVAATEGGARNSGGFRTRPSGALDSSRSDAGQGRCYGNAAVVTGTTAARSSPSGRVPRVPSAPIARFDIEL